jgi:acetyltransferase
MTLFALLPGRKGKGFAEVNPDLMEAAWQALFYPGAVVVVGASPDLTKPGGIVMDNLRRGGFGGPIYPVNPKYREIDGLTCFPDVSSVPGAADLAVIAVPAARVIPALEECAGKGVRAAVVFSSGFGEVDEAGEELQEELRRAAARLGLLVCGPNGMGVVNRHHRLQAAFAYGYEFPAPDGLWDPGIALISQSGGVGCTVLTACAESGMDVAFYVSSGNEAATDFADYLAYFARHPEVRIVAGYMEGVRDGAKLAAALDLAREAGKPVVVLKTGRYEASARAARSHTGALAGSAAVYAGFFRQKGVIQVQDMAEMAAVLGILAAGRLPEGKRVAILASSGGHAVLVADRCAEAGLEVVPFASQTRERLRPHLPSFAATGNPVDFTGLDLLRPGLLRDAATVVASDPGVDALVLSHWLSETVDSPGQLKALEQATDKPVLLVGTIPGRSPGTAVPELLRHGVVFVADAGTAARALVAVAQHRGKLRRAGAVRVAPPASATAVPPGLRSLPPGTLLGEREAKELLGSYGIPVVPERAAATPEEAVRAAAALGYPVAVKVDAPGLSHKTEIGGVRLNLADAGAVREAFAAVTAAGEKAGAVVRGVLVSKMLTGGVEVLVGVTRDPVFGPVLSFGLGGIWVEILRDVALRTLPVSEEDLWEMVREVKGYPLLSGARGRPRGDLEALVHVMLKVARLAQDWPALKELDVNPLFVLPEGRGVCAVDALVVL